MSLRKALHIHHLVILSCLNLCQLSTHCMDEETTKHSPPQAEHYDAALAELKELVTTARKSGTCYFDDNKAQHAVPLAVQFDWHEKTPLEDDEVLVNDPKSPYLNSPVLKNECKELPSQEFWYKPPRFTVVVFNQSTIPVICNGQKLSPINYNQPKASQKSIPIVFTALFDQGGNRLPMPEAPLHIHADVPTTQHGTQQCSHIEHMPMPTLAGNQSIAHMNMNDDLQEDGTFNENGPYQQGIATPAYVIVITLDQGRLVIKKTVFPYNQQNKEEILHDRPWLAPPPNEWGELQDAAARLGHATVQTVSASLGVLWTTAQRALYRSDKRS